MEISGRVLADEVLVGVKGAVSRLAKIGSIPELAIVTVGGKGKGIKFLNQA